MSSANLSQWNSETVNQEAIPLYNALLVGALAVQINLRGHTLADAAFVETVKAINAGVTLDLFRNCNDDKADALLIQYEGLFEQEWKDVFKTTIKDWRRYHKGLEILDLLRQNIDHGSITTEQSRIFEAMTDIFESSFVVTFGEIVGIKPNRLDPSINETAIDELYNIIRSTDELLQLANGDGYKDEGLKIHICNCIGRTCKRLLNVVPQWRIPQHLRILCVFLGCPFFEECLVFTDLLDLYQCFMSLNEEEKNIFIEWNYRGPLTQLQARVSLVRLMITMKILEYPEHDNYYQLIQDGSRYIKVGSTYLALLFEANLRRKHNEESQQLNSAFWEKKTIVEDLHPSSLKPLHHNYLETAEFYNDAINERLKMVDIDFASGYRSNNWVFGLISNPCVLNAAAKAHLMTLDFRQQQRERNRISFGPYFSIPIPRALLITVHRERLVEDALNWLITAQASSDRRELKYPLRIRFAGEEGLDEGGLTKEFFQLLIYQLFNPDYGMFQLIEDSSNFWFLPESFAMLIQFELIGIVLGLALYNDILLDIHFPKVLYKKLLSGLDGFSISSKSTPASVPVHETQSMQESDLPVSAPVSMDHVRSSSNEISNHTHALNVLGGLQPNSWMPRGISYRVGRRGDRVTVTVGPSGDAEPPGDGSNGAPETNEATPNLQNENSASALGGNTLSLQSLVESLFSPGPSINQPQQVGDSGSEFLRANEWDDKTAISEMANRLPKFTPTIDDLDDLYPHAARGLRRLLATPEGEVAELSLTFSVTVNLYGEYKDIPLPIIGSVPYNEDTPVTSENREMFVQAVLHYYLVSSIEKEFRAFYKGFHRCCGGPGILKFSPDELNLVLCGVPGDLDFDQLEQGTKYADGYTRDSQVVNWFWNVANELSQDDKKRLLFFITGCEQTPVGGLNTLHLTIGKAGGEKNRLPTAHTCFNHLLLPEYDAKEDLRRYLTKALDYRHGFGLV